MLVSTRKAYKPTLRSNYGDLTFALAKIATGFIFSKILPEVVG